MSMNYPDNDYRDYLEHSWGEWKQHRYLYKKNGRYYYPSDVGKQIKTAAGNIKNEIGRRRTLASARKDIRTKMDRLAYRQTGLTKNQRRVKAISDALRSTPGNISSALKNARKEVNRRRTLANARKDIRTKMDRLAYRQTGLTKNQRRLNAVGNAVSNVASRAKSNVSNAANKAYKEVNRRRTLANARKDIRTKMDRLAYRQTGRTKTQRMYDNARSSVTGAVSSVRSRIGSAIDTLKQKRKKKKS